jgi:NTP pyrophosphatase (non-canonical NTP hydrolase)
MRMSDPRFLQDGFDKRLAHFIEECGEALAAAGKTQRWGPLSVNPCIPTSQRETNLVWLRREIADVKEAIRRLEATIEEEFS